jgi:hypothetical protein
MLKKVRQQQKAVIWFIWFVSFVWLNQTDQMNQINKTNQFEHPAGYSSGITIRGLQGRILQAPRCFASGIMGNLPSLVAFWV